MCAKQAAKKSKYSKQPTEEVYEIRTYEKARKKKLKIKKQVNQKIGVTISVMQGKENQCNNIILE